MSAALQLLKLNLEGFIWGHGLSIFRIIRTSISLILIIGFILYKFKLVFYAPYKEPTPLTLIQSIYFSAINFVGGSYRDFTLFNILSKIIFLLIRLFGFVFLGFFIAALYRKIARR
ncbi:hypothetical protein DRN69_03390 [Candidatus Pacearchaeota archaeon]|nr:MAG: hypothetical protein DRN69_03390 [Candidatus Pacearchaeota archaeon]